MELYPATLTWADNDCLLIHEAIRDVIEELPVDLCEVYFGSSSTLVTAIVTVLARNMPVLKELFIAGHFSPELRPTVETMIAYADAHPPVDHEYCFVCVEP